VNLFLLRYTMKLSKLVYNSPIADAVLQTVSLRIKSYVSADSINITLHVE